MLFKFENRPLTYFYAISDLPYSFYWLHSILLYECAVTYWDLLN